MLVAGAVAATVLTGVGPAVTAHAATPTVSFHFVHNRVSQKTTLKVYVSSAHLPRATTLYLQRTFGTSHVFRNVEKLTTHNGYATAPGVAMGRYRYRVVAVHSGSRIATSVGRYLWSYGSLTATQLCNRSQYAYFNDCETGTIQVGGTVFAYAALGGDYNTGPGQDANVQATRSSCRSATISYAVSNQDASYGISQFGSSLTQTKADEQDSSAAPGSVGKKIFRIVSPAWDLEFWTNNGGSDVYWNGRFSCWSASGDA